MDETRKYHPEWGNPVTKKYTWYVLTDKWILAQIFGIPRIKFTDHIKLKRKEDQSVDTKEEQYSTKCGAETEGKVIQRLPHLGICPIYSYQSPTLLWMPTSAWWQEPDIVVSWKALLVRDKYRRGCSQPTSGLSTGSSMWARERTEGAEGVCSPIRWTTIWTNQYLKAPRD